MTGIGQRVAAIPFERIHSFVPRAVIGSVVAAALVGVSAVLLGDFGETFWQCLATIALLFAFSLITWYDAEVSAQRSAWFGAVSFLSSAYLFLVGILTIWVLRDDPYNDVWFLGAFACWFWLAALTRVGLLHVHLVINTKRKLATPVIQLVSNATLALVGVLVFLLSLPALFPSLEYGDFFWRTISVVAILDALGTVLIPLSFALLDPKKRATTQPGAVTTARSSAATATEFSATGPTPVSGGAFFSELVGEAIDKTTWRKQLV